MTDPVVREQAPPAIITAPMSPMHWRPTDNPPPPGLGWLALIVPVGVLVGWLMPWAWVAS